MIYLNATKYAIKNGVSKQTVLKWIAEKRLNAWHPAPRIYLINAADPRPIKRVGGRPCTAVITG